MAGPVNKLKRDLTRERLRMDRVLSRIGALKEKRDLEDSVREWFKLYERARFGEETSVDRDTLVEIRKRRSEIENDLRNSA